MDNPVVYFDGHCGLCNRSVDFLLRWDHRRLLRFTPLQGEFAKAQDHDIDPEDLDSVWVWTGEELLKKSEAWLWLMKYLGGFWRYLAWPFQWLPTSWLDQVYDLIARNRHRIFPRSESCRLPTAQEKEFFLD